MNSQIKRAARQLGGAAELQGTYETPAGAYRLWSLPDGSRALEALELERRPAVIFETDTGAFNFSPRRSFGRMLAASFARLKVGPAFSRSSPGA